MTSPQILAVIKYYEELIRQDSKESWTTLYKHLATYDYVGQIGSREVAPCPGAFTDIFLASGVDPAERMGLLPEQYLTESKLEDYTIPSEVNEISKHAFSNCNLKNLYIPGTVTELSSNACYGADSVKELVVERGGRLDIKPFTFASMTNLTTVVLPEDLELLDRQAFAWCPKLSTISFLGTKAGWKDLVKRSRFASSASRTASALVGVLTVICSDGEVNLLRS